MSRPRYAEAWIEIPIIRRNFEDDMLIAVIDPRVRVQRLRIFDLAYSDHPTVVRVTMTPEMNYGVRLSKSSFLSPYTRAPKQGWIMSDFLKTL